MFYVYLIKSKVDSKLYIGFTQDLRRRFAEHNAGQSQATKSRGPFELVYYEAYRFAGDARKREQQLKQFKNAYTRLKQRIGGSLQT